MALSSGKEIEKEFMKESTDKKFDLVLMFL
jgi:hypothetical protein